jgi:hypothetical protein
MGAQAVLPLLARTAGLRPRKPGQARIRRDVISLPISTPSSSHTTATTEPAEMAGAETVPVLAPGECAQSVLFDGS